MPYKLEQIQAAVKGKGYNWFEAELQLNIVGVRTSSTGKSVTNLFDDFITLSYKEGGVWKYHEWPATTEPGKKGVMEFSNPNGVARLVPGQYRNSHVIGRHQGKYDALKQASPVKVYRDKNKDMTYDEVQTQEGIFGINIHKAGANSTYVENWSEGCQVFKRIVDFDEFMRICVRSSQKVSGSFTYTLIESKDVEETKSFAENGPTNPVAETKPKDPPKTGDTKTISDSNNFGDPNKIYVFDVQDETTFFCKDPAMELVIIPSGNDVPQPSVTVYREEIQDPDEVLDDEYNEIPLLEDVDYPENYAIVDSDAALNTILERQQVVENAPPENQASSTTVVPSQPSKPPPPMPGGGSMTGRVNIDYKENGKNWGRVKKGMNDAELLRAMVTYIEGGYYYPAHAYKWTEKNRSLYGSSGETLWGIDRHAGQTENTPQGKLFWGEVDKLSGYGKTTGQSGYSKQTKTRDWNATTYPTLNSAWSYNYSPAPGSPGYDIMYKSFVEYAVGNLNKYLDKYFGTHPLKNMILSDSRMKFMWFRSTWNGGGWFSWYATGHSKKGINGLKWAYDNVTKNVDELIIWDLNNRLSFKNTLITHDVTKMAELLGIKKT